MTAPKARWPRYSLGALFVSIALAALITSILVLPVRMMDGHPVSMKELTRIQIGMDAPSVRSILGEPSEARNGLWTYAGWTWCVVRIRFDKDARVIEIDHDH